MLLLQARLTIKLVAIWLAVKRLANRLAVQRLADHLRLLLGHNPTIYHGIVWNLGHSGLSVQIDICFWVERGIKHGGLLGHLLLMKVSLKGKLVCMASSVLLIKLVIDLGVSSFWVMIEEVLLLRTCHWHRLIGWIKVMFFFLAIN